MSREQKRFVKDYILLTVVTLACLGLFFLPDYSMALKKNVASQTVCAHLLTTSGAAHTTGTTNVYYLLDGGTQTAGSTATHEGNGLWCYTPAQAETNGDHVAFTFSNASAVMTSVQVYTTFPQTGDTYALANGATGFVALHSDGTNTLNHLTGTIAAGSHTAQTGDTYSLANGATGFVALHSDGTNTLNHLTGTLAAGSHVAQTGDTYALANGATGFVALHTDGTNTLNHLNGTLGAGTHSAQTGDAYAYATSHLTGTLAAGSHVAQTGDTYGLANGATGFVALHSDGTNTLNHLNGTLGAGTHSAQTGDGYAYSVSHLNGSLAAGSHVAQTGDSYGYLGSHLNGTVGAGVSVPSAEGVADQVWDELLAGHAGAGSTGAALSAATAPSAATVADAVWDELLAGHAIGGSAGAALSAAGTAGDPWLTPLPGAYVPGTAGYIIGNEIVDPLGPGADNVTITVNDANGNPVAGCSVWITSDLAGTVVIAGTLQTAADGNVLFHLTAGTAYYLWRVKAGMSFSNPAYFIAVAD